MKRNLTIMIGALLIIALFAACSPDPYDGHPSVNATITLDGRGYDMTAIGNTLTVNGSSGVELPVLKSDDSKTFLGWSLNENGTESDLVALENGRYYPDKNGEISLFAVWANNRVTVYYHYNIDADNDIIFATQSYTYNRYLNINKLANDPASYKDANGTTIGFRGWSKVKEAGPSIVTPSDLPLPTEDTHFYAQWRKPVTVTWTDKDGNVVDTTTTLRAFGNLVMTEVVPESSSDDYKYTGNWLDGNAVVSTATIVYSDKTYTAQYGNRVNVTFIGDNGEAIENAPLNYENFPYEFPSVDNPNFAGWFTAAEGGETVTSSDTVPAGTGSITLYARIGRSVTINAVNAPAGVNAGTLSFAESADKVNVNQYPYIGDFSVPSALYSSGVTMDESTMVIDINGNVVDKDFSGEVLFMQWTSPERLYGDIIYKNTSNSNADKYEFYDESYNKVEMVFNAQGQLDDPGAAQPYYYYAEDMYLAKDVVMDINNALYVIVYNENNSNMRYMNNITFNAGAALIEDLKSYAFEDRTSSSTQRPNGYDATELHIAAYKDVAGTIGYYVKQVRDKTGIDDYFVPTLKELNKIETDTILSTNNSHTYFSDFFGLSFTNASSGLVLSSVAGGATNRNKAMLVYGSSGLSWGDFNTSSNIVLFRMI